MLTKTERKLYPVGRDAFYVMRDNNKKYWVNPVTVLKADKRLTVAVRSLPEVPIEIKRCNMAKLTLNYDEAITIAIILNEQEVVK